MGSTSSCSQPTDDAVFILAHDARYYSIAPSILCVGKHMAAAGLTAGPPGHHVLCCSGSLSSHSGRKMLSPSSGAAVSAELLLVVTQSLLFIRQKIAWNIGAYCGSHWSMSQSRDCFKDTSP